MRDGSGRYWFILFQSERIGYKCISPEDGFINNLIEIKKQIPAKYLEFLEEPAFDKDQVTSIWILEENEWIKPGKSKVKGIPDFDEVIN